MLEPRKPELRISRCVSESFNAWIHNLPVLFFATLLALPLSLFLFVVVKTGLLLILYNAISGNARVRVRDILSPLRNPIRFITLNGLAYLGVLLWGIVLAVLILGALPSDVSPVSDALHLDVAREGIAERVDSNVLRWFPAFQSPPHNWNAILPISGLMAFLVIDGGVLLLRCLYLPLIAAHKRIPIVDAYVESRNTVGKYGYTKHIILILIAFTLISLPEWAAGEDSLASLAIIIPLPLALSLIASAY